MRVGSTLHVRRRLADPALGDRISSLGFRGSDLPDVSAAVESTLSRSDEMDAVAVMAERLVDRIGRFPPTWGDEVWFGLPVDSRLGPGLLPLLAFLVTTPEVASFHASRGIPADVTTATLTDLGQQAWVHRLTYEGFGLHTYNWLTVTWSGALYWLGRLQFNLHLDDQDDQHGWELATHIPRTGPLTPPSVDASFAAATTFFATHFPDYPTGNFHCSSWMLDPALAELLPGSNLADFQRRWTLYGDPQPADEDVLFFVFNRRGPVDPDSLPTDTTLRRVVVERLKAGQSLSVRTGRLPQ
jgi:GNAT-like C-terminal domain/N-acyltransferase N-terminal domain